MQILHYLETVNSYLHDFLGGPVMIITILSTGLFLTFRLHFLQLRHFGTMLTETVFGLLKKRQRGQGAISPFQALTTALAATIGTGNIAGVATAITLGGPGAIFWMWFSGFFGMVTKYAEVTLAVHYRRVQANGNVAGGPMYYLEHGLKMRSLAVLFALFGSVAAFGIGNLVQVNSVASAIEAAFNIPPLLVGFLFAVATGLVILGGIRRVAAVTEKLIPLMAGLYTGGALVIILIHLGRVPAALAQIFASAFTGQAAIGGFAGAGITQAIRFGIARGIFTNEAGLGSASIAHAAAQTDHPARQGLWGVFEVFFDTHIMCTVTALVILVTGIWTSGLEGAEMTTAAFDMSLPVFGGSIVAIGMIFFAFATLVAWSYYGEKCFEYLFGSRTVLYYRILWILIIPFGAVGGINLIWALSDTLNGLMAIPNLIGLWGLSSVVVRLSSDFFRRR